MSLLYTPSVDKSYTPQGRVRAMEVLVREKELEADRLRGEIARLGDEARARDEELLALEVHPRSPPPRTKWTRRVPHPVLIGHAASLTPY